MAGRRRNINVLSTEMSRTNVPNLDRITRLLALLVVKGESQGEKVRLLSGAGFANTEIAEMLGLTANAVNVALHRARSKK